MKRKLGFAWIALCAGLFAIRARGDVRDDGNFFSTDAVQRANQAITQLQHDTGRDLVIETYPAIPQERAGTYDAQHKDAFFRQWAIDRATGAHVKGVYILINRDPSYLDIRPEDRVKEREFTQTDSKQLRDQMLPLMKQKKFDDALTAAVDYTSQRFRERVQAGTAGTVAPPAPSSPSGYNPPSAPNYPGNTPFAPSGGFRMGGLVGLIVIVFVGMFILRAIFGRRNMGASQGFGNYGGGYGSGFGGGGGGGFGRGILGGILGGMAGGWLQNRMSDRNSYGAPPPPGGGFGGGGSSGNGSFGDSSNDVSFTGGGDAGGSFDSGGGGGGGGGGDSGGGGDAGGSF